MKTQDQLQNEIKQNDTLIINRTAEFAGSIEDFEWFIQRATTRQLHAFNASDFEGKKPSFEDFEAILHNIDILKEMMQLMTQKQLLEHELQRQTAALN